MVDAGGGERVQKVLARCGLGSRRTIERWIAEGRVTVNGRAAALGARVAAGDVVRVDGRRVEPPARLRLRVLAYNKPEGQICTRRDPEGRPTVYDGLPPLASGRWLSIGRLDITTQGLLLFTNDGELAHRLTHPSASLEREYAVRVLGEVDEAARRRLGEGVELEDGRARFLAIRDAGGEGANHWYHVTLDEGRNREVHRLWASQSVRVSRLVRVRFGPIALPRRLRPGRYVELDPSELRTLLRAAGLHRPLGRQRPEGAARSRVRRARGASPARSPPRRRPR